VPLPLLLPPSPQVEGKNGFPALVAKVSSRTHLAALQPQPSRTRLHHRLRSSCPPHSRPPMCQPLATPALGPRLSSPPPAPPHPRPRPQVRANGPTVLYHGALAASAATFVGHYPWFATYNYLNATLPRYEDDLVMKLARWVGWGWGWGRLGRALGAAGG
jgi:hypothetical protein